ncbi:MAG: PQQ-dependent sugar dehydrogenase [Planctomycetota bacterium]|nr:PQQ-dependent sugar dehydrogenase [Planctomycetota bacterium]
MKSGRFFLALSGFCVTFASLYLPACSSGSSRGGGTAPFGLEARPIASTLTFPTNNPQPLPLTPVNAFSNLSFDEPTFLSSAPDQSDRIFVLEKRGRIRVFPNDPNVTLSTVFLDISNKVAAGGEQGMLGLAFSPSYAQDGFFYVYYSMENPRRSVISRFQVSTGDPNRANTASEEIILEVDQPFSNHNAGMIEFGPDDMLYIALGDGGSGGDPFNNAQNRSTLLGNLLRIDPSSGSPYTIPSDNPFVNVSGARGEIWAYGLRNPWRFSFDRQTGELWLGDVGQGDREEINIITKGGNYGWRELEGKIPFQPSGLTPPSPFIEPVLDYGRSIGNSVTGGYVYRGPSLSSLVGSYLYGDYASGRIFALVNTSQGVLSNTEVANVANLSSFGEDQAGELYAVSLNGSIFKFVQSSSGPPANFPQSLSATGLFKDLASLSPSNGVIEYEVNSPLWSDGARKRRWMALPGQTKIVFHPTNGWTFPNGTVIVKHFEVLTNPSNSTVVKRLETRVLIKESNDWQGYTYRWNAQGTDAQLLTARETETFVVLDPSAPGGQRMQTWTYPSRSDCLSCHTAVDGRILGLRTRQVNRGFQYGAVFDNQLRAFNNISIFTTNIGDVAQYEALPTPSDTNSPVEGRARSYLASNCAHCHQPGSTAPGSLDFRFGMPVSSLNLVGVRPNSGSLGLTDAFIIKAFDKDSSVLWERMQRLDNNRMPPLGTSLVDEAGLDLIGRWIDAGAK